MSTYIRHSQYFAIAELAESCSEVPIDRKEFEIADTVMLKHANHPRYVLTGKRVSRVHCIRNNPETVVRIP